MMVSLLHKFERARKSICRILAMAFIFFIPNAMNGQLVEGEQSHLTMLTDDFYINNWNNGTCYDFEISFFWNEDENITGMTNYFRLDSLISDSDSLKIWYQQEVNYLHVSDSLILGHGLIPIYVDTSTTVYYTIVAHGIPMIPNEIYSCSFKERFISWEDGCNNNGIRFQDDTLECMVIPGEYLLTNDSCSEPIEIIPGLNWANNNNASEESEIEIECFNDVENNIAEHGVWYSFTTPEDFKRIRISTSSTQCDTVELVGTQMAIFSDCDSEPIACSSPGDSLFASLEFDCGVLDLNTTYYVLLDGWAGDTGICKMFYQIYNSCPPGCMDSTACNYNENAYTDDGSCLYGDACIPTHELTIDTIDCHSYSILSDVSWSPFISQYYYQWTVNGTWGPILLPDSPYQYWLPNLPSGLYYICLQILYPEGLSETCIEIYVPEDCDNPCNSEITTSFFGCEATFQIEPAYQADSLFTWDFGNGLTTTGGTQTTAMYPEEGEYTACVDLTNYAGCVDTTLCTTFIAPSCEIDSSLFGCTDSLACNFNPEALYSDESCLYESDCYPNITLTIDSIDCDTYIVSASLDQDIDLFYFWFLNGDVYDYGYLHDTTTLDSLVTGTHTLCLAIPAYLDMDPICVEIYVPESCGQECEAEINVFDIFWCGKSFSLNEPAPDSLSFNWDFGDGNTYSGGSEAFHFYTNDGEFNVCVPLNGFLGCTDTTICTTVELIGCAPDTVLLGCMDPDAINFNPSANQSDSSCVYLSDCAFELDLIQNSANPNQFDIIPSFIDSTVFWLEWDFGDGTTSNEFSINHTYEEGGYYTLCCTTQSLVDNVVCENSFCIDIEIPENGGTIMYAYGIISNVSEIVQGGHVLSTWPNPALDIVNWRIDSTKPFERISLFSSSGELIYEASIGTSIGTIEVTKLSNGIYYLIITGPGTSASTKILIAD